MTTFMDLGKAFSSLKNSRFVILPVPFDKGGTWQEGSSKGPEAILEASKYLELFDLPTRSEPYEAGIHCMKGISAKTPDECVKKVKAAVSGIVDQNKVPIVIGGNHTAAIGSFQTFEDVTIVQLDAHADLNHTFKGSKNNHACVMARAKEKGPIVQIGIRSISKEEIEKADLDRIFFADEIKEDSQWMEEAIRMCGKRVYLTIDLDVFDPCQMPSTGTPEPGGLFWEEVEAFIHVLAKAREIVGFDMVELMPTENKAPDYLAAKLIYRTIAEINKNPT